MSGLKGRIKTELGELMALEDVLRDHQARTDARFCI